MHHTAELGQISDSACLQSFSHRLWTKALLLSFANDVINDLELFGLVGIFPTHIVAAVGFVLHLMPLVIVLCPIEATAGSRAVVGSGRDNLLLLSNDGADLPGKIGGAE